jgi:hypothetical protein
MTDEVLLSAEVQEFDLRHDLLYHSRTVEGVHARVKITPGLGRRAILDVEVYGRKPEPQPEPPKRTWTEYGVLLSGPSGDGTMTVRADGGYVFEDGFLWFRDSGEVTCQIRSDWVVAIYVAQHPDGRKRNDE